MQTPIPMRHAGRRLGGACARAALMLAAVAAAPLLQAQQPGTPRYAVVELGTIEPGASAVVRRLNALGELAAGFPSAEGGPRKPAALVLRRQGPINISAAQNTDFAAAYGINDLGEVAGAFNTGSVLRAFRSVRAASFLALPPLAGDNGGIAYAINTPGDAVGYSSGPAGERAVWWSRASAVRELPGAGIPSRALGINDRGDAVGTAGGATPRPVVWPAKGAAVNLGTLAGFAGGEAVAVNERGEIAGFAVGSGNAPDRARAVRWSAAGQPPRDLGTLAGGSHSRARDINVRGEVVGTSDSAAGERAFLWSAEAGMVDLNGLVALPGVVLTDALATNRNGDIVAVGHEAGADDGHGHDHGDHEAPRRILLLTPLP